MRTTATMKFLFLLAFTFIVYTTEAQTIIRSSINCVGSANTNESLHVQQSTGQPHGTKSFYSNKIESRPGFIQPSQIWVEQIRNTFELEMNVYPNPSTSQVFFKLNENLEDVVLSVVDQKGKMIFQEEIQSLRDYTLNCNDWMNGYYFIHIKDEAGNSYQSKLIKQ